MLGTCMYAYMYIHACICKRAHMCTHVRACVYVCTRVSDTCVHMCAHVCVRAHVCWISVCICVYMHVHVFVYMSGTCMRAYVCMCVHVYIHTEPRQGSLSQPQDQTPSDAVGLHPPQLLNLSWGSALCSPRSLSLWVPCPKQGLSLWHQLPHRAQRITAQLMVLN